MYNNEDLDTYYIFHNGVVFTDRKFKGWKNARKAAKRYHSNAFIMSVHWFKVLKKRGEARKRRAA